MLKTSKALLVECVGAAQQHLQSNGTVGRTCTVLVDTELILSAPEEHLIAIFEWFLADRAFRLLS